MARVQGPVRDGRLALLVDFDGTASRRDVGGALIEHFACDESWKVIDDDYENGRVGSRAAYRILERLLEGTKEEWTRFALASTTLDPGLPALIGLARSRGWELEILSDGLDFYIRALLGREDFAVPIRANLASVEEGRTRIHTPHMNPLCGRCGTCKAERVDQLAGEGYRVVYVGDGYSDLCAGPKAHLLFAKGVLAEHCRARGFPFRPFRTLGDVARALEGQTGVWSAACNS
jgi:2,3-diketo-5-methylthio-1-phosphopentane phosphatase